MAKTADLMKYKNLILLVLVFALLAFVGMNFPLLGAFLAGAYLPNGIVHFIFGIFGFGKITPKKLFGEERIVHSVWGICNFAFSAALIYFSGLEANWLPFIIGVLVAAIFLPIMAKETV